MGLSAIKAGRLCWGLTFLLAAGCATTSTSTAPEAPQVFPVADYYPLQLGWKWSYEVEKDDGQRVLAIYAVVKRSEDVAVIQAGDEQLAYLVTQDGLARRESGITGDFILKAPIAVGTNWTISEGKAQIVAVSQTVTAGPRTFANCVVVEETRTAPMRLVRTTFAPQVGPILVELQVQEGTRFVTNTRATLRGLTKPGQDPLAM